MRKRTQKPEAKSLTAGAKPVATLTIRRRKHAAIYIETFAGDRYKIHGHGPVLLTLSRRQYLRALKELLS